MSKKFISQLLSEGKTGEQAIEFVINERLKHPADEFVLTPWEVANYLRGELTALTAQPICFRVFTRNHNHENYEPIRVDVDQYSIQLQKELIKIENNSKNR